MIQTKTGARPFEGAPDVRIITRKPDTLTANDRVSAVGSTALLFVVVKTTMAVKTTMDDSGFKKLKRAGILAKSSAGATVIEDRLLSGYLAGLQLSKLE